MIVRRRVILVCLAVLATVGTACTTTTSEPPEPRQESASVATSENRLEPRCPRAPERFEVTVRYLNQLVARAQLPSFSAGDIGASTQLHDRRMVWVFGDTVRDATHETRVVANSMLVTSGVCISQVLTSGDGPVVPDFASNVVFWPMSIARIDPPADLDALVPTTADDPYDDLLVVAGGRIRRGGGAFDFTFLGTTAAIFGVRENEPPQLLATRPITPDRRSEQQINWGAALMPEGDFLYAYGTRLTGQAYEFGRELYVARVATPDARHLNRWRFWDGASWVSTPDAAVPVLGAAEGVSQTISVSATRGRYVIVSKRGGDLADFVYTWSAPTPVGPWTPRRGVHAPFGLDEDRLRYAPLAHPEIPLKSGKLLISISRNTTDFTRLLRNPRIGRPQFAAVTP